MLLFRQSGERREGQLPVHAQSSCPLCRNPRGCCRRTAQGRGNRDAVVRRYSGNCAVLIGRAWLAAAPACSFDATSCDPSSSVASRCTFPSCTGVDSFAPGSGSSSRASPSCGQHSSCGRHPSCVFLPFIPGPHMPFIMLIPCCIVSQCS